MSNIDHDNPYNPQSTTHWACPEKFDKKSGCCECSGHKCKEQDVEDWEDEFIDLYDESGSCPYQLIDFVKKLLKDGKQKTDS
jgi:hypothetical protein